MTNLRPPFKIHGGKRYLSSWIIENFPKEVPPTYIEPFAGAASVLLNKNISSMEILNDIDPGVVSIFKTLRDEPEEFIKKLRHTTYSERVFQREFKKNQQEYNTQFECAINEFIVRRMSRGGLKKNFSWSDRKRGGQPGEVNAWETIIKHLPEISERIKNVFIFNEPAIKVIKAFNNDDTLCYVDPPYVPETRVSKDAYEFEMTTDDHIELGKTLKNFKGKVILSGYPSTLYKRLYKEWRCVKKKVANHSSQQKTKNIKLECLWMNY